MNKINNEIKYRNHPLFALLNDCSRANFGGSTSVLLRSSQTVDGWTYNFIKTNNSSKEELSWNDDKVFSNLIKITELCKEHGF